MKHCLHLHASTVTIPKSSVHKYRQPPWFSCFTASLLLPSSPRLWVLLLWVPSLTITSSPTPLKDPPKQAPSCPSPGSPASGSKAVQSLPTNGLYWSYLGRRHFTALSSFSLLATEPIYWGYEHEYCKKLCSFLRANPTQVQFLSEESLNPTNGPQPYRLKPQRFQTRSRAPSGGQMWSNTCPRPTLATEEGFPVNPSAHHLGSRVHFPCPTPTSIPPPPSPPHSPPL